MQYANLSDLISHSNSTRQYFLSLPVETQLSLHEHNNYIHTAAELHARAGAMEHYRRALTISGFDSRKPRA